MEIMYNCNYCCTITSNVNLFLVVHFYLQFYQHKWVFMISGLFHAVLSLFPSNGSSPDISAVGKYFDILSAKLLRSETMGLRPTIMSD